MYNHKIMNSNQPDEWLKDLPLTTEDIRFKSEEMIRCLKCERTNPPNRLKCFYCGAEMEISDAQSKFLKPNLRKLEAWEKGFNIIYLSREQKSGVAEIEAAAELLKVEKEVLRKIDSAKLPLPLARAESQKEAEIMTRRLREFGFETKVVSDLDLAIEKPPQRLRRLDFFDDRIILILFNRDEVTEISIEDLALIVTGTIFERKIEATEKYNKKGDNQILDTNETASDETIIDIFTRRDSSGYRIYAKGFDFSSLKAEKGMLAKDNIVKLAEKLCRSAPNAKFADGYVASRNLLAHVWDVEQKLDSQGLKRKGFGKFNMGNVTTISNLSQFTKYSRLQWHLL
jgi:hypothetical protein